MEIKKEYKKSLVLHSGGQDSTTCLAWALKNFDEVETISFDYEQRHKIELKCAENIANALEIPHKILNINTFKDLGENALTHAINIEQEPTEGELPNTFVPGRNLIFLTYAAAYAYNQGINDIVTGVCQTDYSGYPDCRETTIKSLEKTLNLGIEYEFKLHTPLMHLTKAETVKLMRKLGYFELLQYTHTCYEGKKPACGVCPACKLRLKGFKEAGEKDPLKYQNI